MSSTSSQVTESFNLPTPNTFNRPTLLSLPPADSKDYIPFRLRPDSPLSPGSDKVMDEAKAAVEAHMSRAGKHNTTVHEKVAPGITHETVNPSRHENIQTAIDKEIHQHHYHTSIQPVTHQEILPEEHSHNLVPVEHREFHHGDPNDDEIKVAAVAAQFKDERVVREIQHTHSIAPVITGEHIHHHVHETIQPIVQRETIQPYVVHTTVPIHEVHHNAAQHHNTSPLPAVSMEDFLKQGGVLTGREERYDGFEGEPKSVGGALSGESKPYIHTTSEPTATAS